MVKTPEIKIYNGYGHKHNLVVYGHVFKWRPSNNIIINKNKFKQAISLLKLFIAKPFPHARLCLLFKSQRITTVADDTGFFQFQWEADEHLDAGLHNLQIGLVDDKGELIHLTEGKVYVPHATQYVYVSDIDDTILISHSTTLWKRLRELLIKNPRKRKIFKDNVDWYNQLSLSGTDIDHPNPFFYVSSSEWNLYDYLQEIFFYNSLPAGSFLLSHFKQWYDFFKTGKTHHNDKLRRIERLLNVFPKQRFVLIGDNSQRDPVIYIAIANQFPDRIAAIYIRNIRSKRADFVCQLFNELTNKEIVTYMFNTNRQAIDHALSVGLIIENF